MSIEIDFQRTWFDNQKNLRIRGKIGARLDREETIKLARHAGSIAIKHGLPISPQTLGMKPADGKRVDICLEADPGREHVANLMKHGLLWRASITPVARHGRVHYIFRGESVVETPRVWKSAHDEFLENCRRDIALQKKWR